MEISIPSIRIQEYKDEVNEQELMLNVDMIEERREKAQMRLIAEKEQLARRYNLKLRPHHIALNDLVLRKIFRPAVGAAKLNPGWEGPYRVRRVIGANTFKLAELDGTKIPKTWNSMHLRRYYD